MIDRAHGASPARARLSGAINHWQGFRIGDDDSFLPRRDYETPKACGMNALILKRPGTSGHARPTYSDEAIEGQKTDVISSLTEVLEWIRRNQGVDS